MIIKMAKMVKKTYFLNKKVGLFYFLISQTYWFAGIGTLNKNIKYSGCRASLDQFLHRS
jgi:hypothetical protein